ncbi:helix-turn-helix transcriptional regulator [Phenylobacterium sp.]|uniref:helix-turn-helix transcriptional regulator n=1 Tax=Phenylobacterium sp. TaxID=1871053 RepID=UPI00378381B9
MKLGDAIRAKRLELKMSQEALADAAQINRTHMGEVERGKRNVSVLAVLRIATAMKVQPSDILTAAGL